MANGGTRPAAVGRSVRSQESPEAAGGRRKPAPQATRQMTVIAQDPGVRTADGKRIVMSRVTVPAEILAPGPRGYRVHVVDYDATTGRYYGAYELPQDYAHEEAHWQA